MAETAKKPAIRFKGFTGAWEQRKLADLAEIIGGGTPDTNTPAYWDGDIDWYAPAEMEAQRYATSSVRKITELGLQKSSAKVLPAYKTVLFTSRAGIGKMAILQHPAATNQGFQSLVLKDGTEPYFIYSMGDKIKDMAEGIASGSTFLEISGRMLGNLEVMIPSLKEQQEVAAFFRSIDNLITLHQRKYDKLVNVKKSCLEKMFPKNGSNVPEIRFSGFTEAWEQRKLRNIADKVTEKNADLAVLETFTNSAEFGIISQRDFFDHDISNAENIGGYYVVKNEDFVYNPRISVTAPVGPINRNKLGRNGVMSPLYTVFRTHDIDTTYLEWFFKSASWHDFMHYNGDSGARSDRFSIKDAVFFEMSIPYPEIAEQRKIGRYLDQLDNLITLLQRELEKLQNLKKACLEKMFV